MSELIAEHGGLVPFILACVIALNIILSAVVGVLRQLKLKVPAPLGTVIGVIEKIIDFVTGNLAHKKE